MLFTNVNDSEIILTDIKRFKYHPIKSTAALFDTFLLSIPLSNSYNSFFGFRANTSVLSNIFSWLWRTIQCLYFSYRGLINCPLEAIKSNFQSCEEAHLKMHWKCSIIHWPMKSWGPTLMWLTELESWNL